jgi:alkylresorcinol/alkylpyrone synthase
VAGAAGMARVHDYLRGFPGHVAAPLSVELCSLTLQREDTSIPALIGVCLFGDGAASVIATGADRVPNSPAAQADPLVLATRSRLFPETTDDIATWICHPGGPKVIDSIENAIGLAPEVMVHSRNSMRDNGNISSASVLDVLRRTLAEPQEAGSLGVMLAMGPGFSFELLLLSW